MTEPKWTKGPWIFFNRNGVHAIMARGKEVIMWTGFDGSYYQKQNRANGHLIAASPDFAAAAQMVKENAHTDERNTIVNGVLISVESFDALMAALAKAKGEL